MKPTSLILIAVVVLAVVAVVALKPAKTGKPPESQPVTLSVAGAAAPNGPATAAPVAARLPRLLDLGATKCVPCKLMAPILEEMKTTYAGVLQVDFIDVWEDPSAGQAHGISSIPTQIFFAPDGKELFRHEGFYAQEDMLAKWKALGFELKPAAAATSGPATPGAR
ncbi:MAG: thioredoxin family protein [Planctomycetes bacterium]|nr:thioredoxin family protein [Planctomycetota bacterium]